MSISLEFDTVKGILRVTATGRVDLAEYRQALAQLTSGEQYPPTVPTILDLREFDFDSFDGQAARAFSTTRAEFPMRGKAKVACVVSSPLGYGMMRLVQSFAEAIPDTLVCYQYEEAEQWIAERITPPR